MSLLQFFQKIEHFLEKYENVLNNSPIPDFILNIQDPAKKAQIHFQYIENIRSNLKKKAIVLFNE